MIIIKKMTFGQALRAPRECDEISQAEFARLAGVGRQSICDIERGRRIPSPEIAARYARLLGYHEGQLVRLALQDQIRKAGLRLKVSIEAA